MSRLYLILLTLIVLFSSSATYSQPKMVSLDECIQIALKNNTDIVAARSNYNIYQAGLQSAYGNFMPKLSAVGQWRRRNEELIMFRFKDFVQSKDSYYYAFSLELPLFTGFSNYGNLKKSQAESRIYKNYLTGTEQQTVLQVKLRYYAVIKARELLKVADEAFKASQEELNRIDTMQRIGSVSRAEVYQQKVRVGENQLALIEAQNALSNAKTDLNYTLGININTELNPENELLEFQKIEFDFDELVDEALKNRVDYLAAVDRVKSAKSDIAISRSGYYPQASFGADYNWYDVKFPSSEKALREFDSYSFSVNLQMSLFDGLRTHSNVSRAKATHVSMEAELEQSKRQVILDVKKALLELEKTSENINVTNENLISTEEDYRLARERYNIGAGTLLEQNTAEISNTRAKANRIQALYDYQYSLAALDLAVGRTKINIE